MFVVRPSFTDKFLVDEIIRLRDKWNVSAFIETGTHVGASAAIAAKLFEVVFTCEDHNWYASQAQEALKNIENVHFSKCKSPDLLRSLKDDRYIVFLDAHGPHDFPLVQELEALESYKTKPIIIIHDFYVPDENGRAKFQFDTWQGWPINLELVLPLLDKIYGVGGYTFYFLPEQEISGAIYIEPIK